MFLPVNGWPSPISAPGDLSWRKRPNLELKGIALQSFQYPGVAVQEGNRAITQFGLYKFAMDPVSAFSRGFDHLRGSK
jgi:hypothetical protein